VTTAIVQRLDLQILGPQPSVAVLVFDARIGKLHVPVVLWKVVLDGPAMDLFRRSIGTAIAVGSTAIPLLKKLLILALEFVVEDDAADARPLAAQTFGSVQVRAIDMRVVRQLTWLLEARVEPLMIPASIGLLTVRARRSIVEFASPRCHLSLLPCLDGRAVMTFEDVSALLRQDDKRAVVAGGRRDLDEARFLEMPEIARARVERAFMSVAQVTSRDDAEGAHGGERARLGAAQGDVTATCPDAITFRTTWQVEVPHEHVARIGGRAIARVGHAAATAAAQVARAIIERARVVAPTRIVHLASPSKTAANTGLSCCPTETPIQARTSPRNHRICNSRSPVPVTSLRFGLREEGFWPKLGLPESITGRRRRARRCIDSVRIYAMPRRAPPPSSRRRHPFFWVAAAGVPICAALFISVAFAIWHYGAYTQSVGWTAAATRHSLIVGSVEAGGAADGRLHPGDVIVGVSPGVIPPLGLYRRAAPSHHPYTIHVASPGPHDVELRAVTRAGPLGRLLAAFFTAIVCAVVGLFLGLVRPDLPLGRLLCLSLVSTSFIQLSSIDSFSDQLPMAGRLVTGALSLFSGVGNAVLFHAAVRLPGPAPPRLLWPGLGIVVYAMAALTLATFAIPSAILWWSDVDVAARILFGWSSWLAVGSASLVFTGLLVSAGAIAVLGWKLAFVHNAEERRRLRWLFVGSIVAATPFVMYKVAQSVFITADPFALRDGMFRTIAYTSVAIAPLTLAYAITKHRVLDISVVIRQGLKYLLARNALTVILLLPALSLTYSIIANQNLTIRETLFRNPAYLALIGAAVLALRFRRALGERLDRLFFREAYDRERVLVALLGEMDRLDSIEDVAALVGAELTRALHPKRIDIWIRLRETQDFALAHSSTGGVPPSGMPIDGQLLAAFEQHPRARAWHDGEGADADHEWPDRLEVELMVPIVGAERHVSGVMMLGEKRSEEPYSASDRELLEAIAKQLAVVRDHLRLQERVAEERHIRNQVIHRLEGRAINVVKECPRCGVCYDSSVDRCASDGHELTIALPVDRLVDGQYRLDRLIGRGGMGTVYEAEDLRLQRPVAVKFLIGRAFGEQSALRRFEREARLCARLTHPNIVTVFDYGTLPTAGAYLVMERLYGVTLRDELRRIGSLQPDAAADVFGQILDGVRAAHEAGIIHRDLKPENVLIVPAGTQSRRVKLLDFGLAQLRTLDTAATATASIAGVVMGTVGYMAPEQFAGVRVDERADIFALGVMLAEALTGTRPFDRPTYAAIFASTQLEEFHLPGEAPAMRALDAVLQRCLAKEPSARLALIADVQRLLLPALRACPPDVFVPRGSSSDSEQDVEQRQQSVDSIRTREH
jgi:eukaryotic-like serine/threonine-protein kinase